MTNTLPTHKEMFDIAYRKLARRCRDEDIREAEYLARSMQGYSLEAMLHRLNITPPVGKRKAEGAQPKPGAVGYKKPPVHAQFKPGQSGNPRGRPRKATEADNDTTVDAIQRRMVNTPLTLAQGGAVTKVPPLEALYRNRQKLAFTGSVLATENAIREIRQVMEEQEREKTKDAEKAWAWIREYPEKLVHIHEGRLDVKYCIPHPDYVTFHSDGQITIKGPTRPQEVNYFEDIKDYAIYATVRAMYDAMVLRNLIWNGKYDADYFAIYAHVQLMKQALPEHLLQTVRDIEFLTERDAFDWLALKARYEEIARRIRLPFTPKVPMGAPDTSITRKMNKKFG